MPPFKDELGAAAGRRLAREITRAWPEFPARRFTRGLAEVLEPLALLDRAGELTDRLARTLPSSFAQAADVLYRALESPTFTGWIVLPCGGFVQRAGIDEPDTALPLLAALTPRWSSEFAIRGFIEQHPVRTYEYLSRWCTDADEHVRRLVSEGTRPRLPWAPLLRNLVADPTPNITLLDALVEDSSPYVRRSVANHLNDVSKDHPDIALDLAHRWIDRGTGGAWVVRHGLRTLIKRGDARALSLIGADTDALVELVELSVDRDELVVGESVTFSFTLRVPADSAACDAVIDYRVHYAGPRMTRIPRVFKLTRRRLEPGRPLTLTRAHTFEHVAIRRIHPGKHRIDLQVNGSVLGTADFEVLARTAEQPSTATESPLSP